MALAQRSLVNEYAELKWRVRQKGLLEKQPTYYTYKFLITFGLFALSITCLVVFKHSWFQLLNAVFLAFVFGQIGFIGHDIGHRQIFRSTRLFELAGFVIGNLVLGWSWSWWVDKHNRHHGHPNEADVDPDISIPLLAFTEEAARGKRGFLRFMVKHQAYLYLPLELLGWVSFLIFSTSFLLQKRAKYPRTEGLLMTIHYLLYFGLLFSCLTVWQALLFFVIHLALFGLYLGSVAAPNHKGMLVSDFWYGGLNYQIEHHLMPTIPRNKLREAQQIVKAFCQERGIPYHETGFLQSYREIYQHLYRVSAPLRASVSDKVWGFCFLGYSSSVSKKPTVKAEPRQGLRLLHPFMSECQG